MADKRSVHSWHSASKEAACAQLQTGDHGLTPQQARQRLAEHGDNEIPQAARRSALGRFLLQFHNVLIYVLMGCALITAALAHWIDTVVILAVVIANAVIGFFQEGKAEQALDAIRHMLAPQATVIRGGQRQRIDGAHLVPGDLVLLEAGDKVPADLRLLSAHNLRIQEAVLTGESVAVEKSADAVAADAALGDRASMAFSGTLVTNGQARGVVVATGVNTEIGKISGMIAQVETLTTPLVQQMGVFSKWLTLLILSVAAALLGFGYYVADYGFTEMFMVVVGLSVAAIPEGLPAVLTITLAIGVQSMARRNAIVRRLPAIETLGSVSVICTDKTGTLTRNEMMVTTVVTRHSHYRVSGNGYQPEGQVHGDNASADQDDDLHTLGIAALLCNEAELRHQQGQWQVQGDPMEGALLALAGKLGGAERSDYPRLDVIPFDAESRYMASLNTAADADSGAAPMLYVKGAPEQLFTMAALDAEALDYWHRQAEDIAARGQRVLAFAVKPLPDATLPLQPGQFNGSLRLLGLVGLIDPPRQEAIDAIAECRSAGIRVKMITGDHTKTAAAIGAQIGLSNSDKVLTGADIDDLSDSELQQAAIDCDIFARTSPQHKLRLVTALQARGMTVAMTGDGVNDAPALKRADAGIAMGLSGSEAAKEAADLVLADDNFASIVHAVREGRTVYDNLKKVISWTLPTNAGEALTIIAALLAGMTLPVTAVQILWINLVTAATLGIALAFEPSEKHTMARPPRARYEPLLDGALVWHIVLVSVLFLIGVFGIYDYAVQRGYSLELARTMALNTLVVMEIFHLFFIRNIYSSSLNWRALKGTKVVWGVVILVTLAQFAVTYLPPLQRWFATEAVPFTDGLLIVAVGMALFAIIELEKQARLALTKRGGLKRTAD